MDNHSSNHTELPEMIGKNIERLRKARGMGRPELEALTGIAASSIYRIERGNSNPTAQTIKEIAVALGCTTDELIFSDEENENPTELEPLIRALKALPPEKQQKVRWCLSAAILQCQSELLHETNGSH